MDASVFNPVVVAPTYDNARTLLQVVAGVGKVGRPLIVVNDGSTDATAALLAEAAKEGSRLTVLTHPRNRGKAAALQTGFAAAARAGYSHAVTIDTDGQHDPSEIPKLLDRARRQPRALVLGLRDESAPGYPSKSRLGRRLSNLFIRMESGVTVDDSQCGMRVYPLGLLSVVHCSAGRFGFETEIVTRAGWAGCEVVEEPVACRYLPPGERVSHLHPLLDTLRAIGMHARLLARALSPWSHPKWPQSDAPALHESEKAGGWRGLLAWLNPAQAWRQARRDRVSREAFAAGLAIGTFIGNLPTYGVHAFLGLYAARRLHLHPVAVVIGTQISTPPVGAVLNAVAIVVGHLLLHGSPPNSGDFDFQSLGFLGVLRRMLLEWIVGSPIVGFLCAIAVFMLSNCALRLAAARDDAGPREEDPDSATTSSTGTPESPAAHPVGPAAGPAA